MSPHARTLRSLLRAGLLLPLLAAGCADEADRYDGHLSEARRYRAEGSMGDAIIELRNAIRIDPQAVEAYTLIAEIALEEGRFDDAVFYFREAHRLAPNDAQAAVNLAVLLRSENPKRARELVEGAIAREPTNPVGYVGRAELALGRGNGRAALTAARRAIEVAPEDPAGHWELGYVSRTLLPSASDEQREMLLASAVEGFERYAELGGENIAAARLELARVYQQWPGHEADALTNFQQAVELAEATGNEAVQMRAARLTEQAGRNLGSKPLRIMALQKIVELDPSDTAAWEMLSQLRAAAPAKIRQQVAAGSKDPEEHLREARRMVREDGYDAAVAYLEEAARSGIDPPTMLGAVINLHWAANQPERARESLKRLRLAYPEHPRTVVELAQYDIRRGKRDRGLERLYGLVEKQENLEALRLIAETELLLGNLERAAAASDRTLALTEGFSARDQRLRARILHRIGAWGPAAQVLRALEENAGLTRLENVMLIRSRFYEGATEDARGRLATLLRDERAPVEAALLASEIERPRPARKPYVRGALERAMRASPGDARLLEILTELDLELDRAQFAQARLERTVPKSQAPRVRLLRARTQLALGELDAAREEAEAVFTRVPQRPETLEALVDVIEAQQRVDAEITALRAIEEPEARQRALLGRLLEAAGQPDAALDVYQRAVAADAALPSLQLAYAKLLLARGGAEGLPLAFELAQNASFALGAHAHAAEVLGETLLRKGDAEAALHNFELALRSDGLAPARTYYQRGKALQALGHDEQAVQAFEDALALDPAFDGQADARRQLDRLRGALDTASSS